MEDLITKKRQPRVAAVHDMSCLGSCSLTVALPILSACGLEAVPLPTAVLSTHTGEFRNPYCRDMTGEMEGILGRWEAMDVTFEGIYSGYFGAPQQVRLAQRLIERCGRDALVLVDPVMADNGEWYTGFDAAFAEALLPLVSRADVITPNATEAAFLLGESPREPWNAELLEERLRRLLALGPGQVVITGVELPQERPGQIGYYAGDKDGGRESFWQPKIDKKLHGCGDVFASVLCGRLMRGEAFFAAVRQGAAFVEKAVGRTMESYAEHWYGLQFEPFLRLLG
ncbi:MAG: pyridoxamine kinase [Lachnospiraceae bacterium]|nr:pyridoxamine kinase [Lachnospiraceae bacterium]